MLVHNMYDNTSRNITHIILYYMLVYNTRVLFKYYSYCILRASKKYMKSSLLLFSCYEKTGTRHCGAVINFQVCLVLNVMYITNSSP